MLIVCTVALSWLLMQAAHELGHVLHAWTTGGVVQGVILHPLTISFTDVRPNPKPLAVACGGVIWGVAVPLALWAIARRWECSAAFLFAFFAGFCLIANGAYLAAGAWQPVGDTQSLLQLGVPRWVLPAVGLPLLGAGLWMWNGLGPSFGLGAAQGKVDTTHAWVVAGMLIAVVFAEALLCPT